jgi:hypothetical protein
LLAYTGQAWEDKLYQCGPAPDYDKSAWLAEKETLGLDFPNVGRLFYNKRFSNIDVDVDEECNFHGMD